MGHCAGLDRRCRHGRGLHRGGRAPTRGERLAGWGDAETANGFFVVRNGGDVPVYDVIARTNLPGRPEQDYVRIDMLRPGEQREDDTGTVLDGCDAAQWATTSAPSWRSPTARGTAGSDDTRGRLTRLRRWPTTAASQSETRLSDRATGGVAEALLSGLGL